MPKRTDINKIMIIGAGPIVIGQACEFDYSGSQACKALRQEGYKIILVNSNPATIMTDPNVADITYIEPINDQVLEEIIKFKDTTKVRLVGHASKSGSKTTEGKRINMEISISRAQTIKNMLINKGFDGNNIEVLGKGDLEPLQKEVEEFGEAVNRRVEVFFISN